MTKKVSEKIYETLSYYRYEPEHESCDKIIRVWKRNKKSLIDLLSKHPNYNGNYQILIKNNLQRNVFVQGIQNFCNNINRLVRDRDNSDVFSFVHEPTNLEFIYNLFNCVKYNTEKVATQSIIESANELLSYIQWKGDKPKFTEFQVTNAPRTSRLVKKVASLLKIDQLPEWESYYAVFADAISPRKYPANCVISVHPDDFLKMSNGNSWLSCMWIDKFEVDCITDENGDDIESYSGCYSGGTLSYMLDSTTFMLYLIDEDNPNQDLSDYPKLKRNLFHYKDHKLVQGRVYPQALDGDKQIYKQLRGVVQDVFAKCLGIPNLWKNKQGTRTVSTVCFNVGSHYYDLEHFSDCNVSWPSSEELTDTNKFQVGETAICPKCGRDHRVSEHVVCNSCWNEINHPGERQCCRCGCYHDIDDMHEIEDSYGETDWYCDDCCSYCEYHEEYEREYQSDMYYISNYHHGSYVCGTALESGDFVTCDNCDSYFYDDESIIRITDDNGVEKIYCSEECAKHDGWVKVRGEWVHGSQAVFCENCSEWVYHEEYNFSHDMCNKCLEKPCSQCGKVEDDDAIFIDGKKFCSKECVEEYGYVQCAGRWRKKEDCRYCDTCGVWVQARYFNEEMKMCNECAHKNEKIFCPVCHKEFIRKDGVVDIMEESNNYCCEECAEKDGLVKTDKGYCKERYAFYCSDCNKYYTSENYNFSEGKCDACWEKDRCRECSMRHHRRSGIQTCDLLHYCNDECAKLHGYKFIEDLNCWVREEKEENNEATV